MTEPAHADDTRRLPAGNSLRQRLNIPSDPLWMAGVIVCGAAMSSLLLPWVWIDDWPEPMNAGRRLFFYPSAHGRWYLLRAAPLGVLTVLFAPAFIITAVLGHAGLAIRSKPSGWLAVSPPRPASSTCCGLPGGYWTRTGLAPALWQCRKSGWLCCWSANC